MKEIISLYGKKKKVRLKFDPKKEPSLTKQSDKDQTDINKIMAKYARTGELPVDRRPQLYADFSSVPEYQEAFEIISNAHEQFEELPSIVRNKFNNSPAELLKFVGDKNNYNEAVKLGLIAKPKDDSSPSGKSAEADKSAAEASVENKE